MDATILATLGLTLGLLLLAFAGIAIKLIVKKNGKFAGTCASQSPFLNKDGEACSLCGAKPSEQCNAPSK
ncbi:MAG: membrane or secreted protein [Bacteroidia bacterium]|nr:membrane or secreted protein [Bacteroidia bacterium]